MTSQWLQVGLYAGAILAIGVGILAASQLLGPRKRKKGKGDPYECGVPQMSDTRDRLSVHFYLVAILFILFDIETVFLIPWAVLYKSLGLAGLAEMGIFLAVIVFGLAYIWKRGALEWE
jgi:NADH-quinone oxidoreductase subunit A